MSSLAESFMNFDDTHVYNFNGSSSSSSSSAAGNSSTGGDDGSSSGGGGGLSTLMIVVIVLLSMCGCTCWGCWSCMTQIGSRARKAGDWLTASSKLICRCCEWGLPGWALKLAFFPCVYVDWILEEAGKCSRKAFKESFCCCLNRVRAPPSEIVPVPAPVAAVAPAVVAPVIAAPPPAPIVAPNALLALPAIAAPAPALSVVQAPPQTPSLAMLLMQNNTHYVQNNVYLSIEQPVAEEEDNRLSFRVAESNADIKHWNTAEARLLCQQMVAYFAAKDRQNAYVVLATLVEGANVPMCRVPMRPFMRTILEKLTAVMTDQPARMFDPQFVATLDRLLGLCGQDPEHPEVKPKRRTWFAASMGSKTDHAKGKFVLPHQSGLREPEYRVPAPALLARPLPALEEVVVVAPTPGDVHPLPAL
jgi:hypothetical protein